MSDENLPVAEGPPPAPPREFVSGAVRLRGLVGLAVCGALFGPIAAAVLGEGAGGGGYIALGIGVLLILVHLQMFLRPPRVVVGGGVLELKGALGARTPIPNVRCVFFDGTGLCIMFHDLAQVEPLQLRKNLETALKTHGQHLVLPGFTAAQVDEVRAALGLAPPAVDEPAGQVEEFHRTLRVATPWAPVTAVVIGLNLTVYFLMLLAGVHPLSPTPQNLLDWGADFGPLTTGGQWWRMLTCIFLHIGFFHLLFNMWVLATVGPLVERLVGNIGFLVLYLVAGLAGSVASLWWNPGIISAGASGAIFGVLGALSAVMLTHRRTIPREVLRKLRYSGPAFLGYNLLFGFLVPGIDNAAHVGGLIAGLVGGLLLGRSPGAEVGRERAGRIGLLAGCGGLVVALGVFGMPRTDNDLGKFVLAMAEFPDAEKRVIDHYDTLARSLEANRLTESQFADRVEREVLTPWRDIHRRFREVGEVPADFRKKWPIFQDYLQTRERAWELVVRAIREHDDALFERAVGESQRADRLVEQIKASR
jgi:rhomboid protease GluP